MKFFNLSSLLVIPALLFTTLMWSQEKMDIKIGYEIGFEHNILLEYRLPVSPKLKLNLGGSFFPNRSRPNFYGNYERVLDSNDSLVSIRSYNYGSSGGTIRAGLTYQLPWKLFSVSTDMFLGVRNTHRSHVTHFLYRVPGQEQFSHHWSPDLDNQHAYQQKISLEPGILANFQMNVPISPRFQANFAVGMSVYTNVVIRNNIVSDPLNEFWTAGVGQRRFGADPRASIGFRFLFGKAHERKSLRIDGYEKQPKTIEQ